MKSIFRTMPGLFIIFFAAHYLCSTPVANADTLRVCTYNALNFRGPQDADRYDDFRIVMRGIDADVVVMQEIISEDAVDGLLSFVFLQLEDDWAAATFINGPDTDNALFYRTSKVSFLSQRVIPTTLRDITEYLLQPTAPDTSIRLRVYSLHLKASSGEENENRRRDEAAALRQQLNLLPAGALFIVGGDYNLYRSTEPAYELLLSPNPDTDGQCFDPINTPGEWNNNPTFATIHTQSTRSGTAGGLDDRFDFLLVSAGLMDTSGSYVIPSSYTAYGNDGRHLNQAINNGTNYAVADSVADALYTAADHLPVYVDLLIRTESSAAEEATPVVDSYRLLNCYPNPFNSTLRIQLNGAANPVTIAVMDIMGRKVAERVVPIHSFHEPISFDFSGMTTGSYFILAKTALRNEVQRVTLIR